MQQPFELALFVAITALALALIGYLVRPYFRARGAAGPPGPREGSANRGRRGRGRGPDDAQRSEPQRAGRDRVEGAAGGDAADAPAQLVCPACHREYPAGLQFCPHDARELIAAGDPRARVPASGMTCPACKRSFDTSRRFCAFDGEELVPLALALGTTPPGHLAFAGAPGKICPNCARRYQNEATFCGRDGAELVSVN